jgi:hypothetical protein
VNSIGFSTTAHQRLTHALLNSSCYCLFFCAYTDTRHINPSDVNEFPVNLQAFAQPLAARLGALSQKLSRAFTKNTKAWRKSGLLIDSIDSKPCKPILDEIDGVLAEHYGFTEEELDYIVNYDIKYRMGLGRDEEDVEQE